MRYDTAKEIDRNRLFAKLDTLLKKQSHIEVKEIKPIRSLKNNAYLHVCITLFAIEFGYDLENAKRLLKQNCSFMYYFKGETKLLKATAKLNDKELCDFIDWIRTYSGMQGCYIPTPEEYITNRYEIDKEIDKHKSYL